MIDDGDVVRVVLAATKGGNQIVNTLHYRIHGSDWDPLAPTPHLQSVADWFRDNVRAQFAACITPDWSVQPVEVVQEKDPLAPAAVRNAAASGAVIAGTRLAPPSDEVLPIQVCAIAQLRTGHIGRSFRGRVWLPPVWSDASISGGVIAGSQLGNYTNYVNAIPLAPDVSASWATGLAQFIVFSRTRRAANQSVFYSDVQTKSVDPTVRWLRSRAA